MATKTAGSVPKTKNQSRTNSNSKAKSQTKPAVGTKTKPKTKPKALSPTQQLLLDRLAAALPVLDEECLEALVQSAENLAESCRQDRMLEEARSLALELGGAPGTAAKGNARKKKGSKDSAGDDASPVATRAALPAPLRVEASEDGRFFHIVVDGKWKMLNRDELKSLVNIAASKDPAEAIRTRLFTWLKRERADVLSDLGISTGMSPILAELAGYLKKNFKIKK
ncbi:MAG: hypothetical protein RBT68_07805 [Spirochaetia bacterium]|jgi:hypothetical protein|nr:hypothetical protein [Spirochaetia bacterium]